MFKNPFSFSGRIRRTEYGLSIIIVLAAFFLIVFLGLIEGYINPILLLAICFPVYWFTLAQGIKRCHDRGDNGLSQMLPFYFFIMLFGKGETGPNKYGSDPKGGETQEQNNYEGTLVNTEEKSNVNFYLLLGVFIFLVIQIVIMPYVQHQRYKEFENEELQNRKQETENKIKNEDSLLIAMEKFVNLKEDTTSDKQQLEDETIGETVNCPIIYSVQILATKNPIPLNSKEFKGLKYKIEQLYSSQSEYKYKYVVGNECSLDEVRELKSQINKSGFPKAFIVKREKIN